MLWLKVTDIRNNGKIFSVDLRPHGEYMRFQPHGSKHSISLESYVKLAKALGYSEEMMQLLAEPKYDTMEELLEINKNRTRKRGVWKKACPNSAKGDPFRVDVPSYVLSARTDLRLLRGDAFSVFRSYSKKILAGTKCHK